MVNFDVTLHEMIDQVSDRLERALVAGERPSLEAYLLGSEGATRAELLRKLLTIELDYLRKSGIAWDLTNYHRRFPDDTNVIDEVATSQHVAGVLTLSESPLSPDGCDLSATYIVAKKNEPPQTLMGLGTSTLGKDLLGQRTILNNRYQLERLIGQGGMGQVYLGLDLRLQRQVAVKVIRSDRLRPTTRDGFVKAFEQEAQIGANLIHPAIATVFDYGIQDGFPYAVFEFVSGQTLKEILKHHGALPLEDVQQIIGGLAQALDFAHSRQIVHRDLKPENIRVDKHGQYKILDLGLARNFAREEDWYFAGTPAYAAPEQAHESPSDGRADQYQLALIAYEMLTGHRVFEDSDWRVLLDKHRTAIPDSPRKWIPTLPDQVVSALLRSLQKNPNDRFSTCTVFAIALGCRFLSTPNESAVILKQVDVQRAGWWRRAVRLPGYLKEPELRLLVLQSDRLWIVTDDEMECWPRSAITATPLKKKNLTLKLDGPPNRENFHSRVSRENVT